MMYGADIYTIPRLGYTSGPLIPNVGGERLVLLISTHIDSLLLVPQKAYFVCSLHQIQTGGRLCSQSPIEVVKVHLFFRKNYLVVLPSPESNNNYWLKFRVLET